MTEEAKAKQRLYRAKNREHVNEQKRGYYWANIEVERAKVRERARKRARLKREAKERAEVQKGNEH